MDIKVNIVHIEADKNSKLVMQKLMSFFLSILSIFFIFNCSIAQAQTEYIIGLTAQGIRGASVEEIELGFNYQLQNIGKDKDYLMKIKVFPTKERLIDLLMQRKLTGYFGAPKIFFENKKDFNYDLLYSPVLSGKVLQRYVLLVRKDSGIDSLEKLKNTGLSYCEVDEIGMLYLQKLLKDKKMGEVDGFFSKLVIKKNPNLDIAAVFFKETKASLVLESDFEVASELNPQLKQQLVALETSPEYITNLFAILNNLAGPMSTAELEINILSLANSIQNKKMMKSYNYGAMRKIKLDDLNSVRDLINSLSENKGKSK